MTEFSSEGRNTKLAARVFRHPVHFLAFGFGSGLSPVMPGTVGTLVAVPLYLMFASLSLPWYLLCLLVSFALGVYICGKSSEELGEHDHGGIVWDEFVGYWITMLLAPSGWIWILLGFILFRLFDILKPFPISWIDKRIGGGLGIMLDDVLAGVFAFAVLQLIALLL